jgi:hypothetical protein
MGSANSRIRRGDVSFTTVGDAPSIMIGLRVVGFIQPFSMKKSEWWFSTHTAHITAVPIDAKYCT